MNDAAQALRADLLRWFRRRSPEHAEDLVQDTLLRIHEGVGGLQSPDRLDAWVGRVRRSVWVDHLRRRRPMDELPEITVEPDNALEATETVAAWLPAFVEALPEPYREAVRRVDLGGLSQAQLAEQLGISPSGARARVQRGRAMLRGELEACCAVRWDEGEVSDVERRCGC